MNVIKSVSTTLPDRTITPFVILDEPNFHKVYKVNEGIKRFRKT